MNEVACRALGVYFRELRRKKLHPDILIEGTGCELARFLDKSERIDWAVYCRLMQNVERVWPGEELLQLGSAFLRSPFMRPLIVVGRLLFTSSEFFLWMLNNFSRVLFSCVENSYSEIEKNHIIVDVHISDGYELCRSFFIMLKGVWQSAPLMVGDSSGGITMEFTERGAVYDIRFSETGGALRWLRLGIRFPLTITAAARELKEAHEDLSKRYDDLSKARDAIKRQALQLSTAHRINQAVRVSLDLDQRVQLIVVALVDVAKFKAVELTVSAELDSVRIERSATRGSGDIPAPFVLPLESKERSLGELRLWHEEASNVSERKELLEFVVPIVTLALEEALAYAVLLDYRENLQRKVEKRTTELVEAQRVRDRIFANVNHELRTPLSLIMLSVRELQRQSFSKEVTANLNAIERSARQLLRLVEGLLLLAARQENKLTIKRQPFDIAELLTQVIETWIPVASSQGIDLSYHGPKSMIAFLDAMAMERIVSNLLSNALKFTPRSGKVQVGLTGVNGSLEISVSDTGIGIALDLRDRLFGRFEQGESSTRHGIRGSGIGLSLVKELVNAHGGIVSVDSEPGRGSVFRVLLPLTTSGTVVDTMVSLHPSLQPTDFGHVVDEEFPKEIFSEHPNATPTILVVEDDAELCLAIARLLASDYRVLLASNGMSALEIAKLHQPDLLVTDIEMPLLDGIALTKQWRELPGNNLAPVILLTAYGKLEDRLAGFEAGAVDFVLKPFEPLELLARVRSQLQMRSMALRLLDIEKLRAVAAEYQAKAAEAESLAIAMKAERHEKEAQKVFTKQLIESQEQERKRISVELHDSLSQDLIVIKNNALLAFQENVTIEKMKEHVAEIIEMSSEALGNVRQISHDLRPYQLERIGLTETLKTTLQKVADATPVFFTIDIAPIDNLLAKHDEINLFRIVQESVTNVLKHAQATHASVHVSRNNGDVRITITDDGKGFDEAALRNTISVGLGMKGMTERVQMLNGTMNVNSSIGKGTSIEVTVPIKIITEDVHVIGV